MKYYEGYYEFHISIAGYRRLKPLLKKTKTRLTIVKKSGFPFFLYHYRKRKFFFIGLLLSFGFLFYLTTFIWLIDINGNSFITEDSILTFLKEENASFGSAKRTIDCAALEEALRTRYADIIWASVRLEGTKMTVDIQENLVAKQKSDTEMIKTEEPYDIVAEQDAIITSIITRKGTPKVKSGTEVKKGELLVGSQLEIYNDSNEIVDYIYVTADADIYGQTRYTYQDIFPLEYNRRIRKGKGKHVYRLCLFNYQIQLPFTFSKNEPYVSYMESRQLSLGKNYYLPVIFEKNTYFACDYEKVSLTEAMAKEKAAENVSNYLNKLKEKGIQIKDKNVMIDIKDNQCYIHAAITAIEKIGKYQLAETKKISTDEGLTEHESDGT